MLAVAAVIDAPVIEAHGNIEQKHVASGEEKIEDARELPIVKQDVVPKEIGVHWPTG